MHVYETEHMEKAIEIQKGRILAKAILRRRNGDYEAVVVYAGSMPTQFFFTYKLRSPRSSRKSWKSAGSFPRTFTQFKQDTFEGWLAAHAIGSEIVSTKVYYARKLKELINKRDLDFYGPRQELEPWQTKNLRAKEATKLRGAGGRAFQGWPR